jgi:4-hydroxy-tetrahydrodipicolinate synthase
MFTGCGTALVTPFRSDGSVDENTLRQLIRRQIDNGINFLVPCGTTGESPTLSRGEHLRVVGIAIEEANGRLPILAGAGGSNTAEVIEMAQELERMGANGLLSVTPYYNRPTQEGLYQHYKAIAGAVKLPVIVYSVQGRTGVNVEPQTVKRLSEIENITGIKEASGNIGQIARICAEAEEGFNVLSGDDAVTLPILALGGRGLISVVSNVIPRETTALVQAGMQGEFDRARELQRRYLPLMDVLFVESNPGPVKAALAAMGLIAPVWRLPLVAPQQSNQARIEQTLRSLNLLARGGTGAA